MSVVTIPKEVLGFVNVGTYRIAQSMEHMPLLLEQKVLHSKSTIKVAIQVRSKLSNPDDLSEFSIVVFIPSAVDKDSVTIASGNGEFDSFKRCITWGMEMLPKGESFMVSAKCALDKIFVASQGAKVLEELNFPVMLRCRSKDRLGSVRFETMEADGHPATISSSVVGKSYRIVHRLN
ncbi:unnamed protein product [Pseudo-nitzschia multistriata]|uniref:MHD domain-containing protein n=1 Tax=Pseudo-nitzschia multistriata TaxID=183589 RepID=A0A448YUL7_9STRA|nr:unnamed protein product [Pseudo-nitzschia multistriata]